MISIDGLKSANVDMISGSSAPEARPSAGTVDNVQSEIIVTER